MGRRQWLKLLAGRRELQIWAPLSCQLCLPAASRHRVVGSWAWNQIDEPLAAVTTRLCQVDEQAQNDTHQVSLLHRPSPSQHTDNPTMRFGSSAKALAKCKSTYCIFSECHPAPLLSAALLMGCSPGATCLDEDQMLDQMAVYTRCHVCRKALRSGCALSLDTGKIRKEGGFT